MQDETLVFDRIVKGPPPIYMGPLPADWSAIPAPVVINMCGVFPHGPPPSHEVFAIALHDVQEESALPARATFERFLASIHSAASKQPSYWHCHAGLNRSGLALGAYLHLYHGYRISDAIQTMRDRRSPLVLCNAQFEGALRRWYGEEDEQEFVPVDVDAWMRERTGGRGDWR